MPSNLNISGNFDRRENVDPGKLRYILEHTGKLYPREKL
jgi:hypothetical protein